MFKRQPGFMLCTVILVWVMIMAGCSDNSNSSSVSNESASSEKRESASASQPTDDPLAKKETLKIAWMDAGNWGSDNIADTLREKFNIDFDFVSLNWSDSTDKVNVMVTAGDVPDLFFYPAFDDSSSKVNFIKWAKQGILKPLPDDLSKYPHIEKVMQDFDFMQIDGKSYTIPRIAWQPGNEHMSAGILVRSDYLSNVGITQLPETLDEFVEMLRAFRDKDPDQNGKNDTIPFDLGGVGTNFIQSLFGITHGWIMEDGKYVPALISQKYLAYTKFMKMLYDEKLLNPDFAVVTQDQMVDNFIQGKTPAIGTQIEAAGLYTAYYDKMIQMNPDFLSNVDMLPIYKGPYGDMLTSNQYNHYSATLFNAKMDDAKMDRALQFYDYLLSDEGLDLMRWGIEGEDYKKENGKYASMLPVDEATKLPAPITSVKPTASLKLLVSWDVDGGWDNPAIPSKMVEFEKSHIALYQKFAQTDAGSKINYISDPALDKFGPGDIVYNFYTNAVLGKIQDIDKAFADLVSDVLTKHGGEEAIEVANTKIAELNW